MDLMQLFIAFIVVWILSIITTRVIEYLIYNRRKAQQKNRDVELELLHKDKLISFYRTQAETRDM